MRAGKVVWDEGSQNVCLSVAVSSEQQSLLLASSRREAFWTTFYFSKRPSDNKSLPRYHYIVASGSGSLQAFLPYVLSCWQLTGEPLMEVWFWQPGCSPVPGCIVFPVFVRSKF